MRRTTGKILANTNAHRALTESLRNQSPYYPDYMTKRVYNGERIRVYVSTIVRHKHEGTWYARHHVQDAGEAPRKNVTEDLKKEAVKRLMSQVYLDLKFGEINTDLRTPSGKLLDPVDELQISEKERLDL